MKGIAIPLLAVVALVGYRKRTQAIAPSVYDRTNHDYTKYDPDKIVRKFSRLKQYAHLVRVKSKVYRVNTDIVLSIMFHESGGRDWILGLDGEVGLMQILPSTGAYYGYTYNDLFLPDNNVDCGVRYLRDEYRALGMWRKAIMAFNVGRDLEPLNLAEIYLSKVRPLIPQVNYWWELEGYPDLWGEILHF